MEEIMHYIIYGLITLGLTGAYLVFVYETFKVIKTIWKWGWWGKLLFIIFGLIELVLAYIFIQFMIIGFNAFFY